jgi:hypothetical protein
MFLINSFLKYLNMLSKPPLMNYNSFLVTLYLNLTSFTYANVAQDNSKYIDNLVSAFDNKSILNNWLKSQKDKEIVDVVKEIVVTVKDILIVIDKPDYVDLKNMIIEGDKLLIDETENIYYETRIILKSIARIIRILDTYIDEHYSTKDYFDGKK